MRVWPQGETYFPGCGMICGGENRRATHNGRNNASFFPRVPAPRRSLVALPADLSADAVATESRIEGARAIQIPADIDPTIRGVDRARCFRVADGRLLGEEQDACDVIARLGPEKRWRSEGEN